MTPKEYILSTLEALKEPIQMENIGNTHIEDAIYAKVMSKKFRKLKAGDEVVAITKKAIKLAVDDKRPVAVNIIFGGNKLWRFEESPEIDWAELFSLTYFLQWIKSIASVYPTGARLEYYSEDVVLENMNNLPKVETDRYSETFKHMLGWIKQYLPENVSVSYRRYGDEYNNESEYLAELEEAKKKVLTELGGKLPVLSDTQKAATEQNVRLLPGQSEDPLWREKAELIHQSIERTKTMERYINDPAYIPACPTYFPGCITTGSTKNSIAKFWVGVGALKRKGDSFSEYVLTPKQLEVAKFTWKNINIDGLEGKNFKRVRILTDS